VPDAAVPIGIDLDNLHSDSSHAIVAASKDACDMDQR
jgi:hypothetical protein